ncbi:zinc finger protein 513-like [Triplophysa rosa]|uniref:Zinc finger protein 513 n=2 Tax=Triplophysa rosa TaxID=992332 RepID=A0A9W8C0N6_TRIRA|nr:zinc finger protein 513-like [Triplophysa rosa]KAI7805062.1 putative zinc finger protein 513-like [Triplophysa rosa]
MPRRKQSNPQPVKLEAGDGVVVGDQENLVLESDFLLGQDLGFGENDYRIVGFERDSDSVAADVGMPMYGFSDEDCSTYNHLGMESDFEDPRDTESEREEIGSYLSCRQCGQLLGDPLTGALDLAGLYCLQCGAEGGDADHQDKPQEEAHPTDDGQGTTNRSRSNGNASKTYSCKLCSFTSRYSNHLKRHMKTHNGEKPYQCQHCTYASAQLVNLQRHVRTHTGEKPYKCEFCTFACNSLGNLKRHQRMHAQEKTLDCNQCDFHATNSHSLKKHMMSHKEEKPTEEEAVVSDLTVHITSDPDFLQSYDTLQTDQHPPTLLDTQESDPLPELLFPFTCRVCGLVLEDDEGAVTQICGKCTLDMLSKSSPASPEKCDKLFSCTSCPFVTQYPNHLARHMKTHSGEKPYKCPQCDYASAHFDNLKRHHRVHTGEKPYKCRACDYACGNLANLKRHERIHSGAKPFQCNVCSYSCNQSMNLKRHMLRHTGEKPFKCQECGYTTGHWDNYKRHQKKHGHAAEGWIKTQLPEKEDEEEEGEM